MEYLIGSTPTGSTPLPYETVVDWIGLLLDTHFTQLMLTEESKQLLSRLNRSVNRQVSWREGRERGGIKVQEESRYRLETGNRNHKSKAWG